MKPISINTVILRLLTLIMSLSSAADVWSQQFNVLSFRNLPNDVSAFINPVRDLNDEDCALLKVVAPADFAFSTPLGIVKRVDKTGEIWLYLPRGSKKITVKHAEWGVLRDYEFPSKLESHKTYEISLKYPQPETPPLSDSKNIITTIHDTLVVTRVDTIVVRTVKPKIPLETDLLLGAGIGGKAPFFYGTFMAAVMKRHGTFIHISTDGTLPGHVEGTCDRNGLVNGQERFYSGSIRRSLSMGCAGLIHRISSQIAVFEGFGYGMSGLDWQLAPSEGGGYLRNSYFSHKGLTAEVGIMLKYRRIAVSASVMTLRGTDWYGSLGVGIRLGKNL